jgi:hypothetical protein
VILIKYPRDVSLILRQSWTGLLVLWGARGGQGAWTRDRNWHMRIWASPVPPSSRVASDATSNAVLEWLAFSVSVFSIVAMGVLFLLI